MSRRVLLLSAGLLVGGLSASAIATSANAMPYDYPPPYSAAHPYFHPGYHHYAYRYHHYAHSPYHRRSGVEPYSYYNPER